jgi:hypothetical protein
MALEDNYIYRVLDRISKIENNSILWEYSDTDPLEIGNEAGIRWVRNYLNETYWFIDADGNAIQIDIDRWNLRGNIGINPEINYIGNYDYVDLPFRTNNEERLRITADGNVIIGGGADSISALLNLNSTSKGFLPPRMDTSQKSEIETPEDGLIVFDTTLNSLSIYYDSAWHQLVFSDGCVTSFNERTGDVTLLDTDVTTALGYTPENVANKVTTIVPELINDTEYPSTSAVYNYITTAVSKSFGAFQDDATQYAAASNIGYGVKFNTIDIGGYGVSIEADSLGDKTFIQFEKAGFYNIQFSFQFQNLHNQIEDVTIWIRKNGETTAEDVPATAGFVSVPNSHGGRPGTIIAAWNYFVQANAGDFYQLVWSTTDHTNVSMEYYPAGSPPPSAASAILTVNQVN